MQSWIRTIKTILGRHAAISVLAVATLASMVTYETLKPIAASAMTPAPAAAALDAR